MKKIQNNVPSVTQIVNSVLGEPLYGTEWHLRRGAMLHKAISLHLQGKLNEKTIDARILPHFESAKKAIRDLNLSQYIFVETKLYHHLYQFSGTPDVITSDAIIDWKSSHSETSEAQLGGYVLLAETQKIHIKKCIEIVLEDDRYVITEYKPSRGKSLFLACLTIYNWRREWKRLK